MTNSWLPLSIYSKYIHITMRTSLYNLFEVIELDICIIFAFFLLYTKCGTTIFNRTLHSLRRHASYFSANDSEIARLQIYISIQTDLHDNARQSLTHILVGRRTQWDFEIQELRFSDDAFKLYTHSICNDDGRIAKENYSFLCARDILHNNNNWARSTLFCYQ